MVVFIVAAVAVGVFSCEVHVRNVQQRHVVQLWEHSHGRGGREFLSSLPLLRREVQAEDRGVKQQNDVATVVGGGVRVGLVVRPKRVEVALNV